MKAVDKIISRRFQQYLGASISASLKPFSSKLCLNHTWLMRIEAAVIKYIMVAFITRKEALRVRSERLPKIIMSTGLR